MDPVELYIHVRPRPGFDTGTTVFPHIQALNGHAKCNPWIQERKLVVAKA